MEKSLKDFLDKLVENKESVRIYKEQPKTGSTLLLIYLSVCHAYAGRKVLLLVNDDSSLLQITKSIYFCIVNMIGPDDEESIRDIQNKIKLRYLNVKNVCTMMQRLNIGNEIGKADVIVSLNGDDFLEFTDNSQKTVLIDCGIHRHANKNCNQRRLLLYRGSEGIVITDSLSGETHEQKFNFKSMKFSDE